MLTINKIQISDLPSIKGRYIICLNNNEHINDLSGSDSKYCDGFYIEKRISMIVEVPSTYSFDFKRMGLKPSGLRRYCFVTKYYPHSKVLTAEEVVEKFNNPRDDRYYRLMTEDEVFNLTKELSK